APPGRRQPRLVHGVSAIGRPAVRFSPNCLTVLCRVTSASSAFRGPAALTDQEISMKRFLNYLFGSKTGTIRNRKPARVKLGLESLEDRVVPVVGAYTPAPIADTGMGFDGVVAITGPKVNGSGALLESGRHI